MVRNACAVLGVLIGLGAVTPAWCQPPEWLSRVAERRVEYAIDDLYMPVCQAPGRLRGFAFSDTEPEMREMRATGANGVGIGRMWIPVQDPTAPHGAATSPFVGAGAGLPLAQTFTATKPFVGVEACTPTFTTQGSGATFVLLATPPGGGEAVIAEAVLTDVADCTWSKLTFAAQPPGTYRLELRDPTGDSIGLWAVRGDAYPGGQAYLRGTPAPELDFELAITTSNGERQELVTPTADHEAVRLGLGELEAIRQVGFSANVMIGNWNNGGFPYYPRWFYEANPDMCEVDQDGEVVAAGMFGEEFGWPNIENAAIVDGTARQIRRYVRELRDEPAIASWTLGGESLYATYLYANRWTDYGPEALAHFRAWLARRYGDIGPLNLRWGSDYASFGQVTPPRPPGRDAASMDFLDFRFSSMAERFAWHYQAVHEEDTTRLTMTCNHGDLYAGRSYAAMGARPDLYARAADGWETGQIMMDDDPKRFNLLYCEGLAAFGKPVAPVRLAYKFSDPTARGGGRSFTPAAARRYFYECLGWGNWFIGFIQWRGSLPDGEWGVKGTPGLAEIEKVLAETTASEAELLNMRPLRPRLGLYLSHPVWSLDGFRPEWQAAHELLTRLQVPKVHVYDSQLESGQLEGTDAILSIDNAVISEAALEGLHRFVTGGGHLVIAGAFAEADERLRPRAAPDWLASPRVTRLAGPVSMSLPECLAALSVETPISPWTLDAEGATVEETRTTETTPTQDAPFDLAGRTSVGQTFRVAEGRLASVAVSLPTYSHPTGRAGAVVEVLREGPDGPVVGQTVAAAGAIADNAWVTVAVAPDAPGSERYYVRVRPDAGLQPMNLGVWGTATDSYLEGTLWVDDQPAEGDLRVRVSTTVQRPAEEAVEAFLLSDGLNLLQVFVSVSDAPISADVRLDGRLVPDVDATYRALSLPERAQLASGRGGELRFPLRLEPHGSAMVYLERDVAEADGLRVAAWAEAVQPGSAYARYLQGVIGQMATSGRWAKTAALGACLAGQLGLAVEEAAEGDLSYVVRLSDVSGKPVTGASVVADLVPTEGVSVALSDEGNGRYALRLARSDLPSRYNYETTRYEPFTGPLRVVFTARAGARRGQEAVDTRL